MQCKQNEIKSAILKKFKNARKYLKKTVHDIDQKRCATIKSKEIGFPELNALVILFDL